MIFGVFLWIFDDFSSIFIISETQNQGSKKILSPENPDRAAFEQLDLRAQWELE